MQHTFIRHPDLHGTSNGDSAAKAWILVIHYDFCTNETPSSRRPGDARDIELLQSLFKDYEDCTFREIPAPPSTEIANILSKDGLIERFSDDSGRPTVFMLFIFSHGDENGIIYTEQNGEYFTIYDVWDALAGNELLHDCLKMNIFGSCRGAHQEHGMPLTQKGVRLQLGQNSTCVLGQPNQYNFANMFATVESTTSHTLRSEGSFLVLALDRQLRHLETDVDVLELMRRVQFDVLEKYKSEARQTPQISVFPHRPVLFCSKQLKEDSRVEVEPLGVFERENFYPWCSINQVFKRGHALIFSQSSKSHLVKEFESALKNLEFSPLNFQLSKMQEVLQNVSLNGLMSNEGCLFVVVIAPIEGVEERSATGMTVALGGAAPVPIGHLTRNFVTSQCTAFAEKPKVFIFIDPEVTSNSMGRVGVFKLDQVPEGNNHAGFLIFVGFGAEVAGFLVQHLQSSDIKTGKTFLQESLCQIQTSSKSSPRLAQVWSTMPLKLDFPRCKDNYVPHNFRKKGYAYQFQRMLEAIMKCEENVILIIAPPGMGKSRASEEIHTQLVLRMSNHSVLYVKLSQVISIWKDKGPSAKEFLQQCIDQSKLQEFQQRLEEGRMVAVLDGFDEICPHFRSPVITLINQLIDQKVKVLITSRPQEQNQITEKLRGTKMIEIEIQAFEDYQKLLMLQTRLNVDEERCKEILARFTSLSFNFTTNPLHLQMICETEGIEYMEQVDLTTIYKIFLVKKIKHGLLSCRQIEKTSNELQIQTNHIYSILTKCAVAKVVDKQVEVVSLVNREVMDINLSGVATVVNKSSITFVSQTFAEFLTAQHFMKMCFELLTDGDDDAVRVKLDVDKLFQKGVSEQTMSFIDAFSAKYSGMEMHAGVLSRLKEREKEVFEHICRAGMINFYSHLVREKVFDGEKEREWMLQSHLEANYKNRQNMGLFFVACSSSLELATLLSKWCPMLQMDDVGTLCDCLASDYSRQCLEKALTKVINWNSKWPKASFLKRKLDIYSTGCIEFLLENCLDLDDEGFLNIVFSKTECRKEIFPILLRLEVDLNCEKNGKSFAKIILNDSGNIDLLNFAIKVAKHFQNTKDINSKESLVMRKQIGAKSPQELGLEGSCKQENYLKHIVERACALFDTGECKFSFSVITTDEIEYELLKLRRNVALRPIATTFKLYILHSCLTTEVQGGLHIFLKEQQWIPRDFQYSCGCSLMHDACCRGDLPLMEELCEHNFAMNAINKKGETVLHKSAICHTICTKVLLRRLLGSLYVSADARREDIAARTPQQQRFVEDALGLRDNAGRTPFLSATCSAMDEGNAEVLLRNLLGPLVLLDDEVSRTESEQREVLRILDIRDNAGESPLHGAMQGRVKLRCLWVLLKNLLGENFIDCDGTCPKRPKMALQQQQRIADFLLPKNHAGVTPLPAAANRSYKEHQLFLRNLLGEFFVEVADGSTKRPLNARSQDENQFVRSIIFDEDDQARSLYSITRHDCEEETTLLIDANVNYLLPT